MQFFFLLPNRSLPYLKVVQGERNKKENVIFLLLPNRSLPYLKVVQGERNKKENAIFLFTAEPQPTLFKGSAR